MTDKESLSDAKDRIDRKHRKPSGWLAEELIQSMKPRTDRHIEMLLGDSEHKWSDAALDALKQSK